jgi:hypothetical protein
MTQSHPPKLILQINVPTIFTLPFGDYKEVNGEYGMSFLYAVDVAGVRHGLFADVKLHQAMLNAGTGPGVELVVTKTQESFEKDGQQRRFNTFHVKGGTGTPTQAAPAPDAFAAQVASTAPPAGDAKETYKLMMHHFKRCIAQAEKTYTDCGYTIDKSSPDAINAAAATLFIQTCKSLDLRALSQPQAAPPPPPPPPPTPPPAEPAPPAAAPANNEYDDDLPF